MTAEASGGGTKNDHKKFSGPERSLVKSIQEFSRSYHWKINHTYTQANCHIVRQIERRIG